MNNQSIKWLIDELWSGFEDGTNRIPESYERRQIHEALSEVISCLDSGDIRVAEKVNDYWQTNDWCRKALTLYFKFSDAKLINPFTHLTNPDSNDGCWFDKIDFKFFGWRADEFCRAQIRAVPGSLVRKSAFIGKNVVLMPCFINVGAYVDSGTMIDTWATIGSCAQIGKNCHISGGVGIGGVLEPISAKPVIIEDNCFIGGRSEIAEGVLIRAGSVIGMGVFIGASTKIIDRASAKIYYGEIPEGSVVVSGSVASENGCMINCAIIVKTVDAKTRAKTSINELLRWDYNVNL